MLSTGVGKEAVTGELLPATSLLLTGLVIAITKFKITTWPSFCKTLSNVISSENLPIMLTLSFNAGRICAPLHKTQGSNNNHSIHYKLLANNIIQ